jgi:hypothetical protein
MSTYFVCGFFIAKDEQVYCSSFAFRKANSVVPLKAVQVKRLKRTLRFSIVLPALPNLGSNLTSFWMMDSDYDISGLTSFCLCHKYLLPELLKVSETSVQDYQ